MAGGFSVTISAVDNATKTIDAVNKRLQVMRAPVEKLTGSLQKLGRLSGLADLRDGLTSVAGKAMDAFRSLGQVVAPLGVITGAASLAGMYRLVMSWAEWGQHLAIASQRIGVAAPALAELEGVARRSGSSAEAMAQGLTALHDTLAAVQQQRGSPDQVIMLNRLGLGADFVKEGVEDTAKAMPKLAAALRTIKEPSLRAAVATLYLGGSYESLAPVITLTSAEFAESVKQVRAHGLVTAGAIAKARGLAVAQVDLEDAVSGVRNALSDVAAGPLTDMLKGMRDWLDVNRDWLKQRFNEVLRDFVGWLKQINWDHVKAGAREFAADVLAVAGAIKGAMEWGDKWGLALPLLGAVLTLQLLGPLSKVVSVLGALGAFSPPGWLLAIMGVSGAAAGAMNMPMLGPNGEEVGNWGGAEGERNNAMSLVHGPRGTGPEDDPQSPSYRTLQDRFVPLGQRIRDAIPGLGAMFGDHKITGENGGQASLPKGDQMALARQANAYLLAHGESRASSAGIIASLMRESGLDPSRPGDKNKVTGAYDAYGIGQWHAPRQAAFGRIFGHDIHGSTLEEQLAFKQMELSGKGGDALSALAGAIMHAPGATAAQAGAAESRYGECPADTAGEMRERAALGTLLEGVLNTPAAAGAPVAMPAATAGGAAGQGGGAGARDSQAIIHIRHTNAPAGTKLTAQASGPLFDGPPRIENSTSNIVGGF